MVNSSSICSSLNHPIFQRWFTEALDVLKVVPETPLSPTTPLRLIPMSAVTPYTAGVPFLQQFDPSEPLQLPLSKEMSL
jgi:exocyst complex component 4